METGRQVWNPRKAPSSRTERAYCVSEGVEWDSLRQRLSMDVRCKLLGHVRDSTEFEERHEDRPRGTVLICREFQVCRRCGDREEMYRNEQVLSPDPDEVGQGSKRGRPPPRVAGAKTERTGRTTGPRAAGQRPRTESPMSGAEARRRPPGRRPMAQPAPTSPGRRTRTTNRWTQGRRRRGRTARAPPNRTTPGRPPITVSSCRTRAPARVRPMTPGTARQWPTGEVVRLPTGMETIHRPPSSTPGTRRPARSTVTTADGGGKRTGRRFERATSAPSAGGRISRSADGRARAARR